MIDEKLDYENDEDKNSKNNKILREYQLIQYAPGFQSWIIAVMQEIYAPF